MCAKPRQHSPDQDLEHLQPPEAAHPTPPSITSILTSVTTDAFSPFLNREHTNRIVHFFFLASLLKVRFYYTRRNKLGTFGGLWGLHFLCPNDEGGAQTEPQPVGPLPRRAAGIVPCDPLRWAPSEQVPRFLSLILKPALSQPSRGRLGILILSTTLKGTGEFWNLEQRLCYLKVWELAPLYVSLER